MSLGFYETAKGILIYPGLKNAGTYGFLKVGVSPLRQRVSGIYIHKVKMTHTCIEKEPAKYVCLQQVGKNASNLHLVN